MSTKAAIITGNAIGMMAQAFANDP